MSSDNQVEVKITADASGVTPGVQVAKDEVGGLSAAIAQMSAQMAGMTAAIQNGFAGLNEQLAATKNEMAAVEHETEKEGLTLREVGARMKETALSVHEGVESFNKFKAGIREAMEVYAAFFAVERIKEWSEELGESAEKVEHMSKQFGMSTAQVQQLKGIAIGTGVSVETIAKGLQLLDREAERSPEKFQKLGIEIKTGASQMEIFRATAERFSQYADGPTKIAAAMELMHKSGVEMIPVLDKGADGLDELIAKSTEYGVVNDKAQTAGMALAESVNEGKLAFEGLKQTLTEAFGPILTEIIDGFNGLVKAMTDSYEHGGAVKTIFEAIVSVVEGFGEIFNSIGSAVIEMFHEMGGTAGDWSSGIQTAINFVVACVKVLIAGVTGLVVGFGAGFDDIRGYLTLFDASLREKFGNAGIQIDELKIEFQTLGVVINDVLSLHWGSITADWESGMNRLANVARDGAAKVKNALAGEQQEAAGYFKKEADAQAGYRDWLKTLFKPHGAPERTGIKDTGGGGGVAPNIGHEKKPKKPKNDQASIVQQDEAELQDELLKEENWGADATALTAKFWAEKLATTTQGTKEWAQIHKLAASAQLAEFKKQQQDEVSTIRETASVKAALAKDDADIAKIGLQEKLAAIDEEEKTGRITAVRASQLKAQVNQEMLQEERDYQTKIFGIQMAAMQEELELKHLPAEEQKKIHREMETAQAEFNARMKLMDAQASQQAVKDQTSTADAIRAKWQGILQPVAQAWGQSIEKMITSAGTLRDMLGNVGKAILQQTIGWIEKISVQFIIGEQRKTAAAAAGAAERTGIEATASTTSIMTSALTAIKQIAHSAAVAAARAYAAIAQIPVVGPALAPVAAAAALAGVIALGKTVFSAAGGMDNVPADGTMIYAHKNEMVLSAQYADVIRGLAGFAAGGGFVMPAMPTMSLPQSLTTPISAQLGGNASPAASAGALNGGDTHHHHNYNINALDGPSLRSLVMRDPTLFANAVAHAHRNGWRPKSGNK